MTRKREGIGPRSEHTYSARLDTHHHLESYACCHMQISHRIKNTPASPIRKFAPLEQDAIHRGIEVVHLNIGQPDMPTPRQIRRTFSHFKGEIVLYAPSQGMPETVTAWHTYYRSHGLAIDPADIIVTMGGSEAILFALLATCDPGDEILVFEPFYPNFNGFAHMADVKLVAVATHIENGFAFPSRPEIESHITSRTKAIIINNPNNPTGVVYNREQIQDIVNIAYRKNLFIISDEVYREFIFSDDEPVSLLEFPEIADRAIIIDSVSKRFNHCGGRVGCLVSKNKEIIAAVMKLAQARLSVPTLEQLSVVPLLSAPKEYTDSVRAEYEKRRSIVYEKLSAIPGVTCVEPRGAFYVMAELPIDDAETFVAWMLTDFSHDNKTVLVTPAQGFYLTPDAGKRQIRIAYVLHEQELVTALDILAAGIAAYRQAHRT